jgi:hypothetical protein
MGNCLRGVKGMIRTYTTKPIVLTFGADRLDPRRRRKSPPFQRMLEAGGIAFTNSVDAVTAYPWLWNTADGARTALRRMTDNEPTPPSLRAVSCRKSGQAMKPALAWADLNVVPDPRARLTAMLGKLAWCDVDEPEPS